MTFAHPHLLWLLLVIPPGMILFFWWSARERQRLISRFIQARLLPGLLAGHSPARATMRMGVLTLAAAFLIVALARPQWGYDLQEVRQRGLDIVVAIDTSKSMLAEDITPNRLARAKYAALDLMQQARSDRLGLVAFAGTAFLQCPLTIDDSAFRQSLESLDVHTLPQGGTALAEAIQTAAKAFKEGDSFKVLVLFTDGEDHDSGAVEAARQAAKAGLRIFTIGIGSTQGELLRIKGADGQGDFVRDENGNVVKSHLNEALLQEIAGAAAGFYLPLRGANTIDTLYQKGLAPLPKSEAQEKWVRRAHDRYHWPLAAAILLLVFEVLFPERRRDARGPGPKSPSSPAAAAAVVLGLLLPLGGAASPSTALREYQSGKYGEALKEYEEALQKRGDDPRLAFNAGAAAYRNGQFDQAAKYFGQALAAPDLKLQEQAYYNLANTLFRQGEQKPDPKLRTEAWEEALQRYDSSLKLNPEDGDAKFNQAFVKKLLEELKRQQQQQQDSKQDQKDQNKDQQEQDQQNQSHSDRQKDNKDQKGSSQQPQDQKQNQQKPESKPDSGQDPKQNQQPDGSPQDKKSETQPKKPEPAKPGQPQPDQQDAQQREPEEQYAPGQMTPRQAKQLLDAQKDDEMLFPVSRENKSKPHNGPVKDW